MFMKIVNLSLLIERPHYLDLNMKSYGAWPKIQIQSLQNWKLLPIISILINIKVHHQTIAFYEHNTDASIVSY
jgi:hypothetical protein